MRHDRILQRVAAAEREKLDRVDQLLGGGRVICDRCGATLENWGTHCTAELTELCPGFLAIDDAREGRLES